MKKKINTESTLFQHFSIDYSVIINFKGMSKGVKTKYCKLKLWL